MFRDYISQLVNKVKRWIRKFPTLGNWTSKINTKR